MADCCSSCVHHAIDNGFQCGWCERSGTETTGDSCTYVGECNGTAITERQNCPAPVIIDFDPKSGPTEGGTTITLTGKDLGVTYEEYNFDSIKVGVDCLPIANSFIPGRQILCLTVNSEQVFPETFPVIVTLPYGVASSKTMFKLAIPEIHWVYPTIGPKAGGTTLTVGGLNLNIGNLENTSIIIANGTEWQVYIATQASVVKVYFIVAVHDHVLQQCLFLISITAMYLVFVTSVSPVPLHLSLVSVFQQMWLCQ